MNNETIFVIHKSVFYDAFGDYKNEFKESSIDFLNNLFKYRLSGKKKGFVAYELLSKLKEGKLNKSRGLLYIFDVLDIIILPQQLNCVDDATLRVAGRKTVDFKVIAVSNDESFKKKAQDQGYTFFLCDVKKANSIMADPNFC